MSGAFSSGRTDASPAGMTFGLFGSGCGTPPGSFPTRDGTPPHPWSHPRVKNQGWHPARRRDRRGAGAKYDSQPTRLTRRTRSGRRVPGSHRAAMNQGWHLAGRLDVGRLVT